MSRDLIQLMQSLFLPVTTPFQEVPWRPAVDVYRARKGWLVKFELAGVRPEDISLSTAGRRLTVSGIRRDYFVEEEDTCYVMEITYSRFERCIELPCDLETASLAVDYNNGLLVVRIRTEMEE